MFTEAGCVAVLRCCEQTTRYVERNAVCVCAHTYHSSSSSYTYSYSSSSSSATASSFFDGSDQKLPSSSFNACATAPPTTNARSAVRNRRAVKTAAGYHAHMSTPVEKCGKHVALPRTVVHRWPRCLLPSSAKQPHPLRRLLGSSNRFYNMCRRLFDDGASRWCLPLALTSTRVVVVLLIRSRITKYVPYFTSGVGLLRLWSRFAGAHVPATQGVRWLAKPHRQGCQHRSAATALGLRRRCYGIHATYGSRP